MRPEPETPAIVAVGALETLFDALHERGYTVVGPTVRDGAIMIEELESAAALPYGWGVDTEAGRYRLRPRARPRRGAAADDSRACLRDPDRRTSSARADPGPISQAHRRTSRAVSTRPGYRGVALRHPVPLRGEREARASVVLTQPSEMRPTRAAGPNVRPRAGGRGAGVPTTAGPVRR